MYKWRVNAITITCFPEVLLFRIENNVTTRSDNEGGEGGYMVSSGVKCVVVCNRVY